VTNTSMKLPGSDTSNYNRRRLIYSNKNLARVMWRSRLIGSDGVLQILTDDSSNNFREETYRSTNIIYTYKLLYVEPTFIFSDSISFQQTLPI